MMCPLFKSDCGDDCAWKIRRRRKVDGVEIQEKLCAVVALAAELAAQHEPRSKKV